MTEPPLGGAPPVGGSLPLVGLGACIVLSLALFGPWRREPFDLLDFSEFLLVLQRFPDFWRRLAGMAVYYASQGRVNEIGYAVITANWQLFGLDPWGWHVSSACQMVLLMPTVFFTLRRFGAQRLAATVGASVYAAGSIATAGWLRQTGEPLGTLFMLMAANLAHGWADRPNSSARVALLAACLTAMVLCKETLVATLPFLWLVAACWPQANLLHRPTFDRETGRFALASVVACLVLGAALLWAATQQRSQPYTASYGTSVLTPIVLAGRLAQMTLPIFFYVEPMRLVLFPPNFVYVLALAAGLGVGLRRGVGRTVGPKLGLAAVLVGSGILVYLPWPRFELFYGLPFLFGVALAVAVLADAGAASVRSRLVLVACWLFVIVGSALNAFGLTEFTRARRNLNDDVARQIGTYRRADTVVVATTNLTPQSWQNPAATLSRYVRAVGIAAEPPMLLDRDCRSDKPDDEAEAASRIQIIYESGCGHPRRITRELGHAFRYFDWSSLRFREVIERVAVVEPQ